MPILTLTIVGPSNRPEPSATAARVADATGWEPRRTWVLAKHLALNDYGEGHSPHPTPIFVHVLHRVHHDDLANEAATLARVVAETYQRDPAHVHVIYDPAGAGRVAFGGQLLT